MLGSTSESAQWCHRTQRFPRNPGGRRFGGPICETIRLNGGAERVIAAGELVQPLALVGTPLIERRGTSFPQAHVPEDAAPGGCETGPFAVHCDGLPDVSVGAAPEVGKP